MSIPFYGIGADGQLPQLNVIQKGLKGLFKETEAGEKERTRELLVIHDRKLVSLCVKNW
jgi:hypothetical protein